MNKKFIIGMLLSISQKNNAAISKKEFSLNKTQNVIIAVIDTGVDTEHKDLQPFIWVNEGESGKDIYGRDKSSNGVDDDNNGFIDDIHGWNFVNNNNDVSDSHGHGTHIAGIIKKEFQKRHSSGTSTPAARFMILKYYSSTAEDSDNVINTARAIEYATRMNAQIINYSGGGSNQYQKEFQAIEKAGLKNILFVAAAGNNNSNTDFKKYYPANYPLHNIISVAATDKDGELVPFSNYGGHSVDIAAPGKLIYSTLPHNTYGIMSGTSQATAFVTGVAASFLAKNRILKPEDVLPELLSGSKFNKSLMGKTKFQLSMIN